jgi:hypothetical protein
MLQAEFLQAALVTIYDYYEPCEQKSGGWTGVPQGDQDCKGQSQELGNVSLGAHEGRGLLG